MANKKKTYRRKRSAADKAVNAFFVLIILIVLGLSVFALYPKISQRIADSKTEQSTQEEQQPAETVASVSEQLGITADEFISKYGLNADEVTAESAVSDIISGMNVVKYYEFSRDMDAVSVADADTEEEAADSGEAAEDGEATEAPADGEAEQSTFPQTFEEFISQSGLDPAEVSEDMTVSDLQNLMMQKAQSEEESTETEGETEADTSEPEAQLAD